MKKRMFVSLLAMVFTLTLSVIRFGASAAGPNEIASSIVVDAAGYAYITGSVSDGSSHDYLTTKYDPTGVPVWSVRYDGPSHGDDTASAVAVDAAGHVYVTGTSQNDYATVKYDANGVQQWVARYNGTGNDLDMATAIAVDAAGNVYVTGLSVAPRVSKDYVTIKYNAAGVQQWVARYNGPGDDLDKAFDLAIDEAGNVYVSGFSIGAGTARDFATIKYSADGVQQWVARYNGPGNGADEVTALAVDQLGNVYVTGYSVGVNSSSDYTTIKYRPDGTQVWIARYNGPDNGIDAATALTLDAAGNVYVTGASQGVGTFEDYATVKYSADGVQQWVARYNGPGNDADTPSSIVVDARGQVYVTGASEGVHSLTDYATVKYSADGVQQWVVRYNGPGNDVDRATAMTIDAAGHIYVTGSSVGDDHSADWATMKYDGEGIEQWVARLSGVKN
ncbi:MAG: SBBP repeat-containing protein [Acidobacteriota bacterium]|nr:SBBP repeat-containing protein [Blastocatellia bacterium]MDW8239359.1 SBBP repeat-containing protein [Acidobacteriota bacterium]